MDTIISIVRVMRQPAHASRVGRRKSCLTVTTCSLVSCDTTYAPRGMTMRQKISWICSPSAALYNDI
eukprot:4188978-Pleurochrysis_carterae.AAC.2